MTDQPDQQIALLDVFERDFGVRPLRVTWHDGHVSQLSGGWIPATVEAEFAEPVALESGRTPGAIWTIPVAFDEDITLEKFLKQKRLAHRIEAQRAPRDGDMEARDG